MEAEVRRPGRRFALVVILPSGRSLVMLDGSTTALPRRRPRFLATRLALKVVETTGGDRAKDVSVKDSAAPPRMVKTK